MKRNHAIVVGIIAAVIALGVVWWVKRGGDKKAAVAAGSGSGSSTTTGADPGAGAGTGAGAGAGSEDDGEDDPRYRVIDADARMALMRRITAAREARQAGKPPPPAPVPSAEDPPALDGVLTTDQILDGIMPLMPLFKECYQDGLDRRTITSGEVSFSMHLTGEPDIGTLVDHAELDGDPKFLADAELAQCLHETMMSVELPPMAEGAALDVTTRMVFSPDGPPDP